MCEVHHWYKHKATALHKLATSISKTFDIADVRLLPHSFQEQVSHILPFFIFAREAFGSVTTQRSDALELDARFQAVHEFLQKAAQHILQAADEDDMFTLEEMAAATIPTPKTF